MVNHVTQAVPGRGHHSLWARCQGDYKSKCLMDVCSQASTKKLNKL